MFKKLLIANRGEIAIRIARAAQDLGVATVGVYARDDVDATHVRRSDEAVALEATGPAAYLDIAALIGVAQRTGCDAVHPGYGFLSERADFAEACAEAGLVFVGPTPLQLILFGDKARARALAADLGVPLLPGTDAASLADIQAFFAEQRAADPQCGLMLKAVAGGGGRGMRAVTDPADLPEAFARCAAEAQAAFGAAAVYAERLMARARHIEIQVIGDGHAVMSLGERECTLQRRFQKLVEFAPSPSLSPALRERLTAAALLLARASGYRGLGTFEFLVDVDSPDIPFAFIEANPRVQVEHTVTEAVTGLDLVQLQLGVAAGRSLAALGLQVDQPPTPRGFAVQWRVNAETLDEHGQARPSSGRLHTLDWAQGPGIRIDTHARPGLAPSPHYDSLLAKLIVHHAGESAAVQAVSAVPGDARAADWAAVLRRSRRALAECRIDGLNTNVSLLRALAQHPALFGDAIHTRWVESAWAELQPVVASLSDEAAKVAAEPSTAPQDAGLMGGTGAIGAAGLASDPTLPPGLIAWRAPMAGRVAAWLSEEGAVVPAGTEVLILEAMKMQHGVSVPQAARIASQRVAVGDFVPEGHVLLWLDPVQAEAQGNVAAAVADPAHIRADLQRLLDRQALTADAARPAAVERRHAAGGRTARENIADLCDPESFVEYGALAIAAQTRRRSVDDLQRHTPADGMVTGIGAVNGADFGPERSRCAVLAYDYTVLAGTQGWRNHHKKDRLFALIHQWKLPTVLFAEGGGGRPGDVDMPVVAGLNNHTFSQFAALSGKVPVVGVVHGRCFAGNAALLGCTDVIIATRAASIGMGGPAMIEGGGLGVFKPEEVGPAADLHRAGVIDVLVDDERAAVATARQYLSYFQGRLPSTGAADPRALRHLVPENRLRAYDMRALMTTLFDTGSVLELRAGWGAGMITALARVDGRPVGVFANNPLHLGGAIDPDAADKAARFFQLCEAHNLPLVSLMDTPGFMVGPEVERQAQVRHASRLFVGAARLTVPCLAVVIRKGYGLGAQAMAVGGLDAPVFTVAWPTGEFGAMGLEGAVKLGFRKELDAQAEGPAREALYAQLVARQYENGSAMNMAQTLEIDAVIDPADTRTWLIRGLDSVAPAMAARPVVPGRWVDAW